MGIQQAGWKFYLLFCVFNVGAAVFVYFCVKETQGLTLEEVRDTRYSLLPLPY